MNGTPTAPDTPELANAFQRAYSDTLRSGAQLLNVWRSNLTDERAQQLSNFEAKNFELGALIVRGGAGHIVIKVILQDRNGACRVLDIVDLRSLAVPRSAS